MLPSFGADEQNSSVYTCTYAAVILFPTVTLLWIMMYVQKYTYVYMQAHTI